MARRRAPDPPPDASRDELATIGRALRRDVARRQHAGWQPPAHRRDPVETLLAATADLEPSLVPLRFGRMLRSPFTFFRGAAAVMVGDLAGMPTTGLRVQSCGDCHLLNFGGFATPERRLVFDINDFDETLPAPWEWDVKRLAASIAVAARDRHLGKRRARSIAAATVRSYRTWSAEYARMPALEAWYASIDLRRLIEQTGDRTLLAVRRGTVRRELHHTSAEVVFPKLMRHGRHGPRIRDNPPLVFHPAGPHRAVFRDALAGALAGYRESLPVERRVLFDRYHHVDSAVKIVGIGSVGTLCGVVLMMAGNGDPLFLQIKEARASVLEPYAGRSTLANHGERVVVGQRIMQAATDIFLGWTTRHRGRPFVVRQLRDAKIRPMLEIFDARALVEYGRACGRALARAHARSGRAAAVAAYLGKGPTFDDAVADFAVHYAEQTERDHAALVRAVRAGRVKATVEPG